MNIKKSLLLLLTVVLVFSCKQDELLDQNTGAADLTADISQYDNSNLGLYKGTFTTNDASERGTVEVKILNNVPSRATLTLASGAIISLQSTENVTSGQDVTNLNFVTVAEYASAVRFEFSVIADGTDVEITSTTFGALDGHMLIAKETSRVPVVPITGTFLCTACGTTTWAGPQTFNLLFIGDITGAGPGTLDTDFTLNGTVFSDVGTGNNNQGACVVNGGFMDCPITGFTPIGAQNMDWTGTHKYDSSAAACSQANGTWTYVSPTFGSLAGTFTSDAQCGPPVNDLCANAITVVNGSIETATTTAATTTGQPTAFCVTTDPAGPGVWYKYVSTGANDNVTVNTCGSNYDTKLFVYTDGCTPALCLTGNDDSCGLQSQVVFSEGAVPGVEFLLYAAGFNGATGAFVLNVTTSVPPPTAPGDTFAIAIPITPPVQGTGCGTPIVVDVPGLFYTDSGMANSCSTPGQDIFYTWTTTTDELTFTSGTGAPGATVWDSTGTIEIACLATFSSGIMSGWTIGQNLVIQVYDFNGANVVFDFCLEEHTFVTPPPFMLNLGCNDFIIDNGQAANYANNSNDTYLIDAGAAMVPTLSFTEFSIENGWDYMNVYDGADATAPEITTFGAGTQTTANGLTGFTGGVLQGETQAATGQFMTVVFVSDGTGQSPGFLGQVTCASPVVGGGSNDQVNTNVNRQPIIRKLSAKEAADLQKERDSYNNRK